MSQLQHAEEDLLASVDPPLLPRPLQTHLHGPRQEIGEDSCVCHADWTVLVIGERQEEDSFVSELVDALSPVNHKGLLHQG